ncbi:hypothetical protein COB55_05915 [Candidatus Wolfebacteria bacterium]|nr:MAG: hypothetical protein COB55_05915 [Candidatus Wolfebacteria bacterium]
MNKRVFRFLVILFVIAGSLTTISVYLAGALFDVENLKDIPLWYSFAIAFMGAIVGYTIDHFRSTHKKESLAAYKAATTPKNKYGLYALLFFILFMLVFFTYLFFFTSR